MPRITIRFALIALLLAAIIPTATGIGVSAYLNSRATVELLWHDLADEMIEDARQKVLLYVASGTAQLRLSKLLADEGLVDPADREGLLKYLHTCLLAHPNVTWCSYAAVDGAYLAAYREPNGTLRLTRREQEAAGTRYRDYRVAADGSYAPILDTLGDFDPRTRPWWPVAEHATEPAWSEPFLFASRRQPGVVLVERQDGKDGKMSGVWLMEYELSAIAKYLRDIKESAAPGGGPQSHTDIYIVSGQGKVIGHPDAKTAREGKNGPELIPAREHEDRKLAMAYAHTQSAANDERHFEVSADGQRYLAVSAPFAEDGKPDWMVLIAVPAEALLGRIYENNRAAAWIAALAALLSVLIGILIAERTMGRALRGIASDLDQVGRLDFSEGRSQKKSSIREIAAMHAARDRMTGGLRSFAKYVPADLVRDLMERGKEAALGGETREVTVYFSDIADFTSIAERLSPNALVDQLGDFFDEMSTVIRDQHGTVDKFIGDAIMAFWGAPHEVSDHALAACKAALSCQARLAALRQNWSKENHAEFYARIGINTGEVLVGNIGSDERMNYTVMGDPVNVASRLEAQCKRVKLGIIIGQRTRELAGDAVVARPLDKFAVKGKAEGIIVYELMALRAEATPEQLRAEALGEQAMTAYLARDFAGVIAACRKLLEILPGDVSASELLDRVESLAKTDVPEDWDGVMVLTDK
jgi:adenylate cyclase